MSLKELLTRIIDALKVDYPVEEGTSGIWTYRKWNSGLSECWGTVDITNTTTGYYQGAFPTALFTGTTADVVVGVNLFYGASSNPNRGARALIFTDSSNAEQCLIYMRTTSNQAYSGYYGLRINAKGRWK